MPKCSSKVVAVNAVPKLSPQIHYQSYRWECRANCQSCRCKCSAKVVATKVFAGNAVPKLSLQMQRQSCHCKCSAKVVVAIAVSKLSLRMQCQSCRFKVVAANAVPKLSLQMQCQSCRCKCSAKVVAENAVYFTELGRTFLATLFIALQEAIAACSIDNDKVLLN